MSSMPSGGGVFCSIPKKSSISKLIASLWSINVVGGNNLTLFEVNEAAQAIQQAVDPDANIIFGVGHDPKMDKDVKITLIATGFISKLEVARASTEDELMQLIKSLERDEEIELPSFLRQYRSRN